MVEGSIPSPRTMLYIYGFDPGLTTGICVLGVNSQSNTIIHNDLRQSKYLEVGRFMLQDMEQFMYIKKTHDIEIVAESFLINQNTARNSQAPWSLKLIGLLEILADHMEIPFYSYTPSQSKALITNEVLTSAGLYDKSKQHARDAARQCLYHAIMHHKLLRNFLPKGVYNGEPL